MLVEPTIEDILHVAQRMRAIDRKEVFALRWDNSEEKLAFACMHRGDLKWVAKAADGEPVYAMGVYPAWPGRWELWGFATDRWPEVMLSVTKFIKRNMVQTLRAGLGNRIDCISLVEKVDGHRWLKYLGATELTLLRAYGRNGEDFKWFEWR